MARSRRTWPAVAAGWLLVILAGVVTASAGAEPSAATLTVTVTGGGRVAIEPAGLACSSTCAPELPLGAKVSLTADAGSGSVLTTWGGPCAGAGRICEFELTGDTAVSATFAPKPPTDVLPTSSSPPPPSAPPVKSAPPPRALRPRLKPPRFWLGGDSPPVRGGATALRGAAAPPAKASPEPGPRHPHPHKASEQAGAQAATQAVTASLSAETEVDRALARLPVASVAFNTPSQMRLGQTADIQLLLSLRDSVRKVQDQITEIGEREGARVRVSPYVEARLTGLGFRIEAVTSEQQAISGRDTTEWRWQIEPTTTGTHRLHLTLSAFVHVGSGDRERTIRTFERTLEIRVTWMERVRAFVGGSWQWLWATILVPAGAWTGRSLRKRRTTEARLRLRSARWKQRARPRRPDRG